MAELLLTNAMAQGLPSAVERYTADEEIPCCYESLKFIIIIKPTTGP
jgi:hypothetical protein